MMSAAAGDGRRIAQVSLHLCSPCEARAGRRRPRGRCIIRQRMFERFTERARRTLFFARYEASELGSVSIEPEHLLLGLIRDGTGPTAAIFARSAVSLESVRRQVEGRVAFRAKVATSVEIPFSAASKRVLQFATKEAEELSHNYIGPEHLLVGILHEEQSAAAAVLTENGLRLSGVREQVQRLLKEDAAGIELDRRTDFAEGFGVEPVGPPERRWHIGWTVGWTVHFREGAYWFHREGEAPEGPYCRRRDRPKRPRIRSLQEFVG